ncbi:MAG: YbaB/EbfC family nucleoid-associated protein [Caedimonadaceae bacterium]|nr:MAG: YbaB/EbfC family nucleoid-associated protein [Caedimonadaceae bacterium]
MTNFNQIIKQAQQMQAKMAEAQTKLEQIQVEGTAGGGMVIATMSGKGNLISIKISPEIVDPKEIEMLEDLVVAAINDGKTKAEAKAAEEMEKVTGGMKLPGGLF